jgi:CPA1 family monovalent cation:H+ antiporter
MHNSSHFILMAIISFCCLLAVFIIAKHYTKKSFIPSDAWILIAGIIYGITLKNFHLERFPSFNLDPDIIVLVILPLLIFSSGRLINLKFLKSESMTIGLFATVGVIATSFLIGLPISWILGIPLIHGLLIGAAAAATDPAAVASIFHNFTIPERLSLVVEGESLFNDGTTVVLFGLIGSLAFGGEVFNLTSSLAVFVWAIVAALPLGVLIGWLGALVANRWQERHASYDISITLIISYTAFLIAEDLLHVSGVIAVLMTAITFYQCRNNKKESVSEDKNIDNGVNDFWEYVALIANGILFFSLGATTGLHDFSEVPTIAVVVAVVSLVIARCVVIYGGSGILAIVGRKLSMQWQHVLVLGGLRGAVSAALILMIPHDYPHRGTFLCLIVAMIIFTLIIQPVMLKHYLKSNDIQGASTEKT